MWGATNLYRRPPPVGAISIHAPRVGSDVDRVLAVTSEVAFQSTLPVWGATSRLRQLLSSCRVFQSTLPVWGATGKRDSMATESSISIHAPRVGSDGRRAEQQARRKYFNPRSPCGERQEIMSLLDNFLQISIHAPRVGSDSPGSGRYVVFLYFNPRSPCGERPEGWSGN